MSEGEIVVEIEGEEKPLHFNIVTNESQFLERRWYRDRFLLFLFSVTMFILLGTGVAVLVVYLI